MREEYREEINKLYELINTYDVKTEIFFKHLLLVLSTVFGIVISLNPISDMNAPDIVKFIFSVTVSILGFSILLIGYIIYSHKMSYNKFRQEYQKALQRAIDTRSSMGDVLSEKPKYIIWYENLSLVTSALATILLVIYAIAYTFLV